MAVVAQRNPAAHRELMSPGMMGMFIFLTSEVMFFGSLFAMYFYLHGSNGSWPPSDFGKPVEPFPIPTINTVLLLSSGVTMHIAHLAMQDGDRRKLIRWLIPTILLGLVFEVGQAIEFMKAYGVFGGDGLFGTKPEEILRFDHTGSEFATAFFTLTGFHGIHVLGGLLFLGLILWRAFKGHFTAQHHVGVAACAIYWHFVDLVWVLLFGILYVGVAYKV